MRYAFVVNPVAGKGNHENGIISSIENVIADNFDADIGLYMTKGNKEAISLSETLADEAMKAGDEIVVFACGGDGTAFEVANGIYGYDNAMLGLVPIGSGNDLVRELARGRRSYKDYANLNLQMNGRARKIDVMKISWDEGGEEKSCISLNGINIGFDGNAAVRANELKNNTFLSGSLAYIMAVFSTLIKKDGQNLRISADGEAFYEGELLLATVGNGGYCGGGIRSCPFAILDDGEMELMAIRDMNRLSFVSKFPKYRAGLMFQIPGVDRFATYKRSKEVIIEPLGAKKMKYVADGEVMNTGTIKVEVQPQALTVWDI